MTLRELAGEPYGPGGLALRVALVRAPEPGAVVAAHHGALDGLGLIALLSLVLGERVATSARGVTPSRPRRGVFGLFVLRRMAEALLWPPTRIAGHTSATAAPGEQLAQRLTPVFRGGVAALAAASARTVISWNGAHGEDAQRVVIAIGASRRSGAEPTLEHRAAWMRISAGSGSDDEVAAALRQAPPLPVGPASSRLAGPGRLAAALLSRRLGSTLLLSNLGAVSGPPELQELSFYPVTHGQRAVALGAATVGGRTTLTLRGEGRDFDAGSSRRSSSASQSNSIRPCDSVTAARMRDYDRRGKRDRAWGAARPSERTFGAWLAAIAVAGLLLRALYATEYAGPVPPIGDSAFYSTPRT